MQGPRREQMPRRARQERGPCEVRRADSPRRPREVPQGNHQPARRIDRRVEVGLTELARRRELCSECDYWDDADPPTCDLLVRRETAMGIPIPAPAREPAPCLYEAGLRRPGGGCPLRKF
jgi:hypothetical protein